MLRYARSRGLNGAGMQDMVAGFAKAVAGASTGVKPVLTRAECPPPSGEICLVSCAADCESDASGKG